MRLKEGSRTQGRGGAASLTEIKKCPARLGRSVGQSVTLCQARAGTMLGKVAICLAVALSVAQGAVKDYSG